MDHKEWPELIPIVKLVLKSPASTHRGNFFLIKAFMGQDLTLPVITSLRYDTVTPVTVKETQHESAMNVEELVALCTDLHPRVPSILARHRKQR